MRSAWFGAVFSAVFFSGFGAHAQAFPDNGVFDRFLNAGAPECVPVKAFESVSKVTELSPAQFEFVRAIYVTLPPMSRRLPPGDHAVIAKADGVAMLALVSDGQACARFLAPDFILAMLNEVGRGRAVPVGTPAVVQRQVIAPYRFLPQIGL
jgi:hypothetical protein